MNILVNRVTVSGFLVSDHEETYAKDFYATVPQGVADGLIKFKEHVTQGLENTETAFIEMLTGGNLGKACIKVASA